MEVQQQRKFGIVQSRNGVLFEQKARLKRLNRMVEQWHKDMRNLCLTTGDIFLRYSSPHAAMRGSD